MLTALRRRAIDGARSHRDETGITVLEVTVASFILLIVMAMVFSMLDSLTRNEARTQINITNEQSLRFAADQLSRDLRDANPLDGWTAMPTYATSVQVELGPTAGVRKIIRWTYDPTAQTLVRQTMSNNTTSATVLSTNLTLNRIKDANGGAILFSYFGQHGEDLVNGSYDGHSFAASNIDDCSVRIRVSLSGAATAGQSPVRLTFDAQLRNRQPGEVTCGPTS